MLVSLVIADTRETGHFNLEKGCGWRRPSESTASLGVGLPVWESYVWPIVAARVPQFESVKLTHQYAAHYEVNIFDHNAIVGPHTTVNNFHFINGFSGHGMQQSPAMGRGMAELLIHGEYRTLDLTPFQYRRIEANEPIVEKGVI